MGKDENVRRVSKMKERFLLTGMIILLSCLLTLNLAVGDDEIENLARGGDFETEDDRIMWNLNLANASATMTIDRHEAAVGDSSLFIDDIVLDPDRSWKPQIDQGNIEIFEKGEYTISAFLKGEEPRPMGMYSELLVDPWTKSPDENFDITTEWAEYWATGVPLDDVVGLGFRNRGSTVSYWIDGVRFYAGEYVPTDLEDVPQIAVTRKSKLATTWGDIKHN
jgi:hypothetical protein